MLRGALTYRRRQSRRIWRRRPWKGVTEIGALDPRDGGEGAVESETE